MPVDLNLAVSPIIQGVTSIFPKIGNLIVSILPVLLILAVVGLLYGIMEAVQKKMK
jgi:hypothetical protein